MALGICGSNYFCIVQCIYVVDSSVSTRLFHNIGLPVVNCVDFPPGTIFPNC